jgi:tRNA dimethylallyltransferase
MNPVLFIVGATGTGKSKLALELAQRYNLPIINADSVQVYQRVDLGTAKPTAEERRLVPHYLLDEVAPPNLFTAGQFRARALEILAQLIPDSPVIVVGGSGFYVQALQRGMFEVSEVDPSIAAQLRTQAASGGLAELYAELKSADPEFAERISAHDSYRVVRALALIRTHGKTPTRIRQEFAQKSATAFPYPFHTIGLKIQRESLRSRLRVRTEAMIANGLIDEVRTLVNEGWAQWSPLLSVGYKETQTYLQGQLSVEELVSDITLNSMKLAKRQSTWFRRDPEIEWFDVEAEWPQAVARAGEWLQAEVNLTGARGAAKMRQKE